MPNKAQKSAASGVRVESEKFRASEKMKATAHSLYIAAKEELSIQDLMTSEATRKMTEAFDKFKDAEANLLI